MDASTDAIIIICSYSVLKGNMIDAYGYITDIKSNLHIAAGERLLESTYCRGLQPFE